MARLFIKRTAWARWTGALRRLKTIYGRHGTGRSLLPYLMHCTGSIWKAHLAQIRIDAEDRGRWFCLQRLQEDGYVICFRPIQRRAGLEV